MFTSTAPNSGLDEKRQLVDAWLNTRSTIAPDAVWNAHMELVPNNACDNETCRICTVYCDVCDHHYPFDDTCKYH